MKNIEIGIVEIIVGIVIIIFRKRVNDSTFEARNRMLGNAMGEKMKMVNYWVVITVAALLVAFGIVTLFYKGK